MKYLITFLLLPLFALTQTNNPMPGKQVQLSNTTPLHTIEEYGITVQLKSLYQPPDMVTASNNITRSRHTTTIQVTDKEDSALLSYYHHEQLHYTVYHRPWKTWSIYVDSVDINQVTLSIHKNKDLLPDIQKIEQVNINEFRHSPTLLSLKELQSILFSATITDFGEKKWSWSFAPAYSGRFISNKKEYGITLYYGNLIHLTLSDSYIYKPSLDLWLMYK